MSTPFLGPGVSPVGYQTWREECASDREPRRGGFTLVELLVVLSVIAAVAGILLPVLAQVRERARQTTCLSQLKQLAEAHLLYLQDWDEHFPYWYLPAPPRPSPYGPRSYWTEYLQPYVRSGAIFHDPSADGPGPPLADGIRLADYALMTWGPGGFGTREAPSYRWAGPPLALAQIVRPTETIDWMDGWTNTSGIYGWGVRHSEGINAGFVDGHVRWVTERELWRVDQDRSGVYWLHYGAAER